MPLTLTGEQVLLYVGVKVPDPIESAWADACALAVVGGINTRLNGAVLSEPPPSELTVAMGIAAGECFKRREAAFGLTGYADMEGAAIRVSRDYLTGIAPLIDRYSNGPGIG